MQDMQRALKDVRDDDTVSLAVAARRDPDGGAAGDPDVRSLCLQVTSRDGTAGERVALPRAARLAEMPPHASAPVVAVLSARNWQQTIDLLCLAAGDTGGTCTYMDVEVSNRKASLSLAVDSGTPTDENGTPTDRRSAFATLSTRVYPESPVRQRLRLPRHLCAPTPFADIAASDTLMLYLAPMGPRSCVTHWATRATWRSTYPRSA